MAGLPLLSRYVVLNPVRAGMVETAADWSWSSYQATMGKAVIPEWLAMEQTLALFHHKRSPARRAYARFVADGLGVSVPWTDCPRAGFIVNDAFVERMMDHVEADELSPEVTRETRPTQSLELIVSTSQDRNQAIRRAHASAAYSVTGIARHVDIRISTATRIARGVDAKRKTPYSRTYTRRLCRS